MLERGVTVAGLDASRLVALSNAVAMLRETIRSAGSGAGATTSPLEAIEMARRLDAALERWERWAQDTANALDQEKGVQPETDPEMERVQAVLALLEGVQVRRAAAERSRQERERLTLERDAIGADLAPRAGAAALSDLAYRTFVRVKNEEVQRIFDELRADLVTMYDFLHPGEGHEMLSIAMDPDKRGSTELRMGFYDRQDEDPRAFGSEGHLDSLGLCIFLAFVKRFNGDWPLLVLDDVVSSVDIQHKRRVANLLFEEFGDRQLLITTQDSRWFNELRRAQEETGHSADTRNLAIETWSLEEGPKIRSASV
jgi:hypothetical protein